MEAVERGGGVGWVDFGFWVGGLAGVSMSDTLTLGKESQSVDISLLEFELSRRGHFLPRSTYEEILLQKYGCIHHYLRENSP